MSQIVNVISGMLQEIEASGQEYSEPLPRKRLTVELDEAHIEYADSVCALFGISRTALINMLLPIAVNEAYSTCLKRGIKMPSKGGEE